MTTNPIEQFRDAIHAAGLTPPDDIQDDGKIHRFASNGKKADDSGWYALHLDGFPAGVFGDWRTGVSQTWKADTGCKQTKEEAKAHQLVIDGLHKQRRAEEEIGHEAAAKKAAGDWGIATPATEDHGYLKRKGIKPHGVRVLADGRLAVPMRDTTGKVWNLERITPEKPADGSGDKKGLYRGKRIGCYFSIGNPKEAAVICIAEGFATGASIHEATGYPVAVAFNAGNLEPVAKALRRKLPDLPMLICADDDHLTAGNPGRTKAEAAALAVGAVVAFPVFHGERGDKQTDFNDLHQAEGLEAVQRIFAGAVESIAVAIPEPQPNAENPPADDSVVEQAKPTDAGQPENNPAVAPPIPTIEARPCYRVLDTWVEHGGSKYRPGVWYFSFKEGKESVTPTETFICGPLHVDAITYDTHQDASYGRLLRFKNTFGRRREWAMPMTMLAGEGVELRAALLDMGLEIDPNSRQTLPRYLQAVPPKRRIHCATQVGWAGGSFVLPDTVIGPKAAGVIFQSGERGHEEHKQAGTLDGWRAGVAEPAVGNPLLLLALSAGFAGPMLSLCHAESGGIHFYGESSTGKSTAIEAACSIWGGPGYKRSWRATANGIEGAASLFNDCLLALDEISEADPRQVGEVVYMLGNGRGKQRAGRTGAARGVVRWRCFVISNGEFTIATTMQEAGQRTKAGQSVRLLDIPAARVFGAWDTLHGAASAAAFSDAIKRATAQHHGLVGRAFLEKLTRDERDFCALLEEFKSVKMFAADGGEGQDKRAAGRFALIGLSGELATEYGLTGWQEGEAMRAAGEGFKLWQAQRGKGNNERRQVAEKVSGFIERHGDGRFSDADATNELSVKDRAGWWRDSADGREYLLTAEAMREALRGFDFNRALDVLQELGALPKPGADGKRARLLRIGGKRPVRLYSINPQKLAGGDHGA